MTKKLTGFALLTMLVAQCAFAIQVGNGTAIRGNSSIDVNAENVNTVVTGSGNVGRTTVGAVKKNGGGGNVVVNVKNVSNVVSGRKKKGCINIGVKGADPDCK